MFVADIVLIIYKIRGMDPVCKVHHLQTKIIEDELLIKQYVEILTLPSGRQHYVVPTLERFMDRIPDLKGKRLVARRIQCIKSARFFESPVRGFRLPTTRVGKRPLKQ